jgi:hypothetical protein
MSPEITSVALAARQKFIGPDANGPGRADRAGAMVGDQHARTGGGARRVAKATGRTTAAGADAVTRIIPPSPPSTAKRGSAGAPGRSSQPRSPTADRQRMTQAAGSGGPRLARQPTGGRTSPTIDHLRRVAHRNHQLLPRASATPMVVLRRTAPTMRSARTMRATSPPGGARSKRWRWIASQFGLPCSGTGRGGRHQPRNAEHQVATATSNTASTFAASLSKRNPWARVITALRYFTATTGVGLDPHHWAPAGQARPQVRGRLVPVLTGADQPSAPPDTPLDEQARTRYPRAVSPGRGSGSQRSLPPAYGGPPRFGDTRRWR